MDFLDPKYQRAYKLRLYIGYGLLSIAIGLATIILVYAAYGYGINTKTGQIIENGLVFADSKPSGAKITLNGKDQGATTSARLVLSSGDYSLSITKTGYRDWKNSFTLDQHSIKKFNYVFLFPEKLQTSTLASFSANPSFITQSPDLHRLIIQTSPTLADFSLESVDTGDVSKTPEIVSFPSGLFTNSDGQILPISWTSDDNKLLAKHIYGSSSEYILLDIAKPANSFNVNKLFNSNPTSVALRDHKADQLYLYDNATKVLQLMQVSSGLATNVRIQQVDQYAVLPGSQILYTTKSDLPALEDIKVWDNNQRYKLTSLNARDSFVLEASEFQGHWYYLISSNTDNVYNLYQDPVAQVKDPALAKASPYLSLTISSPTNVSFSPSGQNLVLSSGKDFVVYDLENKNKIKFSLTQVLNNGFGWMDNFHFVGNQGGNLFVTDYDGTNQQILDSTTLDRGGYFSKDYKNLLVARPNTSGSFELVDIALRAGADLPKP